MPLLRSLCRRAAIVRIALLIVVGTAFASPAHADFLYTYNGWQFDGGPVDPGWATGAFSLSDHITATLLISDTAQIEDSDYGPTLSLSGVEHYEFTVGGHHVVGDGDSLFGTFEFNTASAGALPWDWFFVLSAPTAGVYMNSWYDNGERVWIGAGTAQDPRSTAGHYVYNHGEWTVHEVPEPATWVLLAVAMTLLGGAIYVQRAERLSAES